MQIGRQDEVLGAAARRDEGGVPLAVLAGDRGARLAQAVAGGDGVAVGAQGRGGAGHAGGRVDLERIEAEAGRGGGEVVIVELGEVRAPEGAAGGVIELGGG